MFTNKVISRFEVKFCRKAPNECWEWTAAKDDHRYGAFNLGGKITKAHRVSYILYIGPIPAGLCVLHRCDNPPCVNPAHLWLGTPKDNADDRTAKGRAGPRDCVGVKNPAAILSEEQVLEIMKVPFPPRRHGRQELTRKLAAFYGVKPRTIQAIRHGEKWKHLLQGFQPTIISPNSGIFR